MRKIIFMALAATFILTGCKSKEEKVAELIKNEMFKTLPDFDSYQPIETKIDSAFHDAYNDPTILNQGYTLIDIYAKVDEATKNVKHTEELVEDCCASGDKEFNDALTKYEQAEDELNILTNKLKEENEKMKQLLSNTKPDFFGWKVTHKFRAKTIEGNSTLVNYVFYLDEPMKTVLYNADTDDKNWEQVNHLIDDTIKDMSAKKDSLQ